MDEEPGFVVRREQRSSHNSDEITNTTLAKSSIGKFTDFLLLFPIIHGLISVFYD